MGIFWLKVVHITAMSIWFTGLFFLPRLFAAHAREGDDSDFRRLNVMAKTLYFRVMTPAGLVTIGAGLALIAFGFQGIWLPAKLMLVTLLAMLHIYFGQLLIDLTRNHTRHRESLYRVLNWMPLLLLIGIAALTAAKPQSLPFFG